MSGVKDQPRRSAWVVATLVLVAAALTMLGLYRVWHNYQTIGIGYELAAETLRHRALFGQNRKLRLEFSSLEHEGLDRLLRRSPESMKVPAPEDLIHVPK